MHVCTLLPLLRVSWDSTLHNRLCLLYNALGPYSLNLNTVLFVLYSEIVLFLSWTLRIYIYRDAIQANMYYLCFNIIYANVLYKVYEQLIIIVILMGVVVNDE